jgi:cytochrome P450
MIAFPEVQRRAQAELDSVVGRDRLPIFADAPRLPYVCAIVREVLRWRPVVPLGLPHAAIQDDWYEGMFIPKGTVCVPNIWHCNHDQEVFGEDANEFRPERHLNKQGELVLGPVQTNHAGHVSFGFGRRLCPGKDLINDALFIDTSCMLWAAKFERAQDKNGKEMALDLDMHVDAKMVT